MLAAELFALRSKISRETLADQLVGLGLEHQTHSVMSNTCESKVSPTLSHRLCSRWPKRRLVALRPK